MLVYVLSILISHWKKDISFNVIPTPYDQRETNTTIFTFDCKKVKVIS